jgi:hypothetical protein
MGSSHGFAGIDVYTGTHVWVSCRLADIIVWAEPSQPTHFFEVILTPRRSRCEKKLEFALWGTDHNDASGDCSDQTALMG